MKPGFVNPVQDNEDASFLQETQQVFDNAFLQPTDQILDPGFYGTTQPNVVPKDIQGCLVDKEIVDQHVAEFEHSLFATEPQEAARYGPWPVVTTIQQHLEFAEKHMSEARRLMLSKLSVENNPDGYHPQLLKLSIDDDSKVLLEMDLRHSYTETEEDILKYHGATFKELGIDRVSVLMPVNWFETKIT